MVRFEYPAVRAADFSDGELLASDNPFALVLLAAKKGLSRGRMPEGALLEEKERLITAINRRISLTEAKREALLRFVEEKLPG
jgi:hypothetical protein